MYLVKTPAGQQAFKERHAEFSPRLRSAFLQFDGRRSLAQVLELIAGLGVTQDELMALVDREWLAPREGVVAVAVPSQPQAQTAPETVSAPVRSGGDASDHARRYRKGYPMAVALTAGMGLKGFRLNMAVEAAIGYEQLVALAPRLRDAASAASYAPFHEALFGAEPGAMAA